MGYTGRLSVFERTDPRAATNTVRVEETRGLGPDGLETVRLVCSRSGGMLAYSTVEDAIADQTTVLSN